MRLLLGTSAATQNDWEEARKQLEQAQAELPQMPVLLNNLAWVRPRQTPRSSIRLCNWLTRRSRSGPKHPEIRETRGVVLAKLSRWSDALADLELALTAFPDRARLHEQLAEIYDQLGGPDMADKHRKWQPSKAAKEAGAP